MSIVTIWSVFQNPVTNIQQKEERLVCSTNLFILPKKVKVKNNKYQFNNKQFNLHENVTFPYSSDQVSPPVCLGLKLCFQGLLMSCMVTRWLVTPSSAEDDPIALVSQNFLGRESQ